jgi:hypothetical protein
MCVCVCGACGFLGMIPWLASWGLLLMHAERAQTYTSIHAHMHIYNRCRDLAVVSWMMTERAHTYTSTYAHMHIHNSCRDPVVVSWLMIHTYAMHFEIKACTHTHTHTSVNIKKHKQTSAVCWTIADMGTWPVVSRWQSSGHLCR